MRSFRQLKTQHIRTDQQGSVLALHPQGLCDFPDDIILPKPTLSSAFDLFWTSCNPWMSIRGHGTYIDRRH